MAAVEITLRQLNFFNYYCMCNTRGNFFVAAYNHNIILITNTIYFLSLNNNGMMPF